MNANTEINSTKVSDHVADAAASTSGIGGQDRALEGATARVAEQLTQAFEEFDFVEVVEPVREFVRERPLQSLCAGLGVGFLIGRLLR